LFIIIVLPGKRMSILTAASLHSAFFILDDFSSTLQTNLKQNGENRAWYHGAVLSTSTLALRFFSLLAIDNAANYATLLKPLTDKTWIKLTPLCTKFLEIFTKNFKSSPFTLKIHTLVSKTSYLSQGMLTIATTAALLYQTVVNKSYLATAITLLPIPYYIIKQSLFPSTSETVTPSITKALAKNEILGSFNDYYADKDLFDPALIGFLSTYTSKELTDGEEGELKEIYETVLKNHKETQNASLRELDNEAKEATTSIRNKESGVLEKLLKHLEKTEGHLSLFSKKSTLENIQLENTILTLHQKFPEITEEYFVTVDHNKEIVKSTIVPLLNCLIDHDISSLKKAPPLSSSPLFSLTKSPPLTEAGTLYIQELKQKKPHSHKFNALLEEFKLETKEQQDKLSLKLKELASNNMLNKKFDLEVLEALTLEENKLCSFQRDLTTKDIIKEKGNEIARKVMHNIHILSQLKNTLLTFSPSQLLSKEDLTSEEVLSNTDTSYHPFHNQIETIKSIELLYGYCIHKSTLLDEWQNSILEKSLLDKISQQTIFEQFYSAIKTVVPATSDSITITNPILIKAHELGTKNKIIPIGDLDIEQFTKSIKDLENSLSNCSDQKNEIVTEAKAVLTSVKIENYEDLL
jgi:hypothetical protein